MTGMDAAAASSSTDRWAKVRTVRAVEVQRQRPGRVGDRLAAAQLELVRPEDDRQHPEHPRGGLEADPGPRRRLVEEHADPPAGQAVPERVRISA